MCAGMISQPETLISLSELLELNSINLDYKGPNEHKESFASVITEPSNCDAAAAAHHYPPESLPIQLNIQLMIVHAILHAATVTVVVTAQTLPQITHASPGVFRALAMRSARLCFFSSSVNSLLGLYDIGSGD